MKKTLVAIAALAAVSAFAQSSVTIGGQLDVGLTSESHNNFSATGGAALYNGANLKASWTRQGSGNYGASRVFFAGSEDLGGGLKANFRLEMQPSLDSGGISAAGLFNRAAWAGVSGTFGTVQLGRQGTASTALVCGTIDQHGCYGSFFGAGVLFSGANLGTTANGAYIFAANPKFHGTNIGGASQAGSTNDISAANTTANPATSNADATRYTRAIVYMSPNISGFTGRFDYAFDGRNSNQTLANGKEATTGFGVNYANGPLAAGLAYQSAKMGSISTLVGEKATLTTFGGSYNLGVAVLRGGLQSGSSSAVGFSGKHKSMSISALFPMGAVSPYVVYNTVKNSGNGANAAKTNVVNLGAQYSLSKRTIMYADYATNKGTIYAGVPQSTIGATPVVGASLTDQSIKGQIFSVGLRHNF